MKKILSNYYNHEVDRYLRHPYIYSAILVWSLSDLFGMMLVLAEDKIEERKYSSTTPRN